MNSKVDFKRQCAGVRKKVRTHSCNIKTADKLGPISQWICNPWAWVVLSSPCHLYTHILCTGALLCKFVIWHKGAVTHKNLTCTWWGSPTILPLNSKKVCVLIRANAGLSSQAILCNFNVKSSVCQCETKPITSQTSEHSGEPVHLKHSCGYCSMLFYKVPQCSSGL